MITIINFIKKLLRRTRTKAIPVHASYIIPRNQHRLSKTDVSPNALKVVNRLVSSGYQAYIVGGSVRDILVHQSPKDFDVATNATPNQVRALFRNARVIGRRFKLVHVLFHREIIEVATFRGKDNVDDTTLTNDRGMIIRDNVFGSLEEDAWRRDFTINSLYYNMVDSSIVDYTGGVADIHNRMIRIIGDASTRYQEDPVRMLRAVRFSAKLDFTIADNTAEPIHQNAHLLEHVSNSRLFDEMTKLYQCGAAQSAQVILEKFGLFQRLFPPTARLIDTQPLQKQLLDIALQNTDARLKDGKPVNPAFIFAVLLWFPLKARAEALALTGIPPLPALEKAMSEILSEQNQLVNIPKRFTQVMREIWILQFRFPRRNGTRALNLLEHPRFRAAYDFLAIRALAKDESMELANWWTSFQEESPEKQLEMISALNEVNPAPKKRRRRKPKAAT